MANETKRRPEEELHGEPENRARFGYGAGDADSPYISKDDADQLEKDVYGDKPAVSPGGLEQAERSATSTSSSSADNQEHRGLFKKDEDDRSSQGTRARSSGQRLSRRQRARKWARRHRKKIAGGGLAGGVIGVSFMGLGVVSGPLQLIQLSQVLSKSFGISELKAKPRMSRMIRTLWTGDYSNTRVGARQSYLADRTERKLGRAGVTLQTTTREGLSGLTFDLSNERNSNLRGASNAEIRRIMNLQPGDQISIDRSRPGRISVSANPETSAGQRVNSRVLNYGLSNTVDRGVGKLYSVFGGEKVAVAASGRHLKAKFNVPSMFHRWRAPTGAAKERLLNQLGRGRAGAAQAERQNGRARTEAVRPAAERAGNRINKGRVTRLVGAGIATTVSVGNELACYVKNRINAILAFNYAAIVVPSLVESMDKISAGSQIKSGDDFDVEQAGLLVESFEDENGQDIWQSVDLDAIAKNGQGAKGNPMEDVYLQAFVAGDKPGLEAVQSIRDVADDISLCRWYERVGLGLAGVVLLIPSLGVGGVFKSLLSARSALGAAKFAGVLLLLDQIAKQFETGLAVEPPLQGPNGGGLLAYGSRAAAGENSRAAGGVALSDQETSQYMDKIARLEREEMHSKSFFARTFDVYDYRSLVSQAVIQKTSPSPSKNVQTMATGLVGIGENVTGVFANAFSSLTPSVTAQGNDEHVFVDSMYGVPDEVLNDSRLADPWNNIFRAGEIVRDNDDYIDKAKKCYGVELTSDNQGLNVKRVDDTDPSSSDYLDANCAEDLLGSDHDFNWRRITMAIHDWPLMEFGACWENDDEACSNMDIETLPAADGGGESSGAFVDGDYAFPIDLAKDEVGSLRQLPCTGDPNRCHHDGTPALDLAHKDTFSSGGDSKTVGKDVYAIIDGEIVSARDNYAGQPGCFSIQFQGKDGYIYWYGHIANPVAQQVGRSFSAGDKIAQVGPRRCTGNGSPPHLHIDRGSPKGDFGGSPCCRDPGIVDIINNIFKRMPE